MTKHNSENERIKRKYLSFLEEARRYSVPTVDAAAKALNRFEEYNRHRDFKRFHSQQAVAFKKHLAEQNGQHSGQKLSKATLHATLTILKDFFFWLAREPGYKSRIEYSDAEYFNLSEKDVRVATAHRERKAPTLEQVKHVIASMPNGSEIERRNRALMAFTLLTGARDSAIASMKLKHVDVVDGYVFQDAREVRTKFSKTFTTYFFPVGEDIRAILIEWVRYLREEKLWGNDDPLFPATRIVCGQTRQFEAAGLERAHWSTATPIRAIFRTAFQSAGLPYFHPHSLRNTLVGIGQRICKNNEEFKAWSQNLGHKHMVTTMMNYGTVREDRQGELIRGLGAAAKNQDAEDIAERILRELRSAGAFAPTTVQNEV